MPSDNELAEAIAGTIARLLDKHPDQPLKRPLLNDREWRLIEAALRARPEARAGDGTGWQDISTAPSDGRRVLAWGAEWGGPKRVAADGDWWRHQRSTGAKMVPTLWLEERAMPKPPVLTAQPNTDGRDA